MKEQLPILIDFGIYQDGYIHHITENIILQLKNSKINKTYPLINTDHFNIHTDYISYNNKRYKEITNIKIEKPNISGSHIIPTIFLEHNPSLILNRKIIQYKNIFLTRHKDKIIPIGLQISKTNTTAIHKSNNRKYSKILNEKFSNSEIEYLKINKDNIILAYKNIIFYFNNNYQKIELHNTKLERASEIIQKNLNKLIMLKKDKRKLTAIILKLLQ